MPSLSPTCWLAWTAPPRPRAQAERLPLTDEDRAERLRRLAERLVDPDGFDRDTLARIEELSGDDQ